MGAPPPTGVLSPVGAPLPPEGGGGVWAESAAFSKLYYIATEPARDSFREI